MLEPLSVYDYLKDLGDNYSIFEPNEESIKELLKEVVDEYTNDFSVIRNVVDNFEELLNKYDNKDEDEVIIQSGGYYLDTSKTTMMGYYEDVWTWKVGVLLSNKN